MQRLGRSLCRRAAHTGWQPQEPPHMPCPYSESGSVLPPGSVCCLKRTLGGEGGGGDAVRMLCVLATAVRTALEDRVRHVFLCRVQSHMGSALRPRPHFRAAEWNQPHSCKAHEEPAPTCPTTEHTPGPGLRRGFTMANTLQHGMPPHVAAAQDRACVSPRQGFGGQWSRLGQKVCTHQALFIRH